MKEPKNPHIYRARLSRLHTMLEDREYSEIPNQMYLCLLSFHGGRWKAALWFIHMVWKNITFNCGTWALVFIYKMRGFTKMEVDDLLFGRKHEID